MSDFFAIPWTVACQAPLSMGYPRQEYWSGLPFPSPGDLPSFLGREPLSPAWQVDSLSLSHLGSSLYTYTCMYDTIYIHMYIVHTCAHTYAKHTCIICMCVHATSFQSCPTLCDPVDCSLPVSSAHEILQARILE